MSRPALSFARRNERPIPAWGDDPRSLWQRIDWGYIAFAIGWATVAFTLTYIALERAS